MENLLQVNDAEPSTPSNEGKLNASLFLVNEFRYKCTADKEGNVDQVIFTNPFDSDKKNFGAPQNPRYADHVQTSGKPSRQVHKSPSAETSISEKELLAEKPTPCR